MHNATDVSPSCAVTEQSFLGGGRRHRQAWSREEGGENEQLFYPKQIFVFGGETHPDAAAEPPIHHLSGRLRELRFAPPPRLLSQPPAWEECRGASH